MLHKYIILTFICLLPACLSAKEDMFKEHWEAIHRIQNSLNKDSAEKFVEKCIHPWLLNSQKSTNISERNQYLASSANVAVEKILNYKGKRRLFFNSNLHLDVKYLQEANLIATHTPKEASSNLTLLQSRRGFSFAKHNGVFKITWFH